MVASPRSKPAVDLRHLQTFLVVAEAGSFSRAAEQLGVSQPPLSRQIQRLEASLNVQLFDRSRAQIRLTEAGRVFAQSARRIIAQVEQGIYDAQQVSQGLTGEIIVGVDGRVIDCDRIIQFLSAYQSRFPDVRLHIKELSAQGQYQALQDHEMSLGFVAPWAVDDRETSDDIARHVIVRDMLSVVLPAFHPLAIASQLSFTDLADEAFVINNRWQQYLSNIAQQQQHALFTPNIVQSANTLKLILSFVALDKGITLLPASIEQQIPHPNLVYRPLHPPTKADTLSVIWRQDETHPTLTGLIQTLMRDGI